MTRDVRREQADPLSIWAERDDRARLVLGADLSVRWHNDAARRLIAQTGMLALTRDRLSARESCWARSLQLFCDRAGATSSTLCLPRSSGDHILCTVLLLAGDGHERTLGLTLRLTSYAVPIDVNSFQAAFELTVSERRVAELLFAGHTADEAACGLRLALSTVRVHIRHIYDKLGVGSREAMFGKMLPFVAAH